MELYIGILGINKVYSLNGFFSVSIVPLIIRACLFGILQSERFPEEQKKTLHHKGAEA